MARKIQRVTIADKNRDAGKVFVLTEMNADQAERWAMRLIFGLMNAGVDIPEDIASLGMAGIAALGIKSLGALPFTVAEPLLDEMMECVQIAPDPRNPVTVRGLIADDIEEVKTRAFLRMELFKLHIDFFTTADQSTLAPDLSAQGIHA